MKKAISVACSVFLAVVVILCVFSENIGLLTAKLLYTDKTSSYSVSESQQTISLSENDYIYFGKFNGEPVLWKVVSVNDKGNPLLFSEKVICFLPFNSNLELKSGSSNWETSTIREWLNSDSNETFSFECTSENKIKNNTVSVSGGFLSSENFSPEEISSIKDNGDKISLPSIKMLSGIPAKSRKKAPTVNAVINCNSQYYHIRPSCWYWAKNSIETNTSSVSAVTSSGSFYKSVSNDGMTGVCPVTELISINIVVCGGNGSMKSPYVFKSEGTNE